MQKLITTVVLGLMSVFFASGLLAQITAQPMQGVAVPSHGISHGMTASQIKQKYPSMPLSVPITFSGTTPVGLEDMYQAQFANRGLHNIVIDPDHPQNIHAAITFALNVTEADTVSGTGFLPQLRVYYIFSSDDGKTWSVPKPIDTARTSTPEMILIKRGTDNIPVIAAVRDFPDTNTPYFCSLYIEQGSSGTGNFKEFRTDRKTFRDSLRNIDYPSIALSHDGTKIYMTAGIDNNNRKNPGYIQFSTFTLTEGQKSVTWGGWKQGPDVGTPGQEDPIGLAYSWSTSVRVSPAGKLGVAWINRDFQTPDLSTYLSESSDEGVTWLAVPKTIYNPVASATAGFSLVALNYDFWYAGENAECALAGFYYNRDSLQGLYIPQSGSLLFWMDGMAQPVLLVSKENDTQFGPSNLDGSWLSTWSNTAGSSDPQGLSNLNYPTVARTSNPNVFSIYFSAWQDGDIEDLSSVGQIGTGMYISYPYLSIWRTTTLDGGLTFSGPDIVHANDLSNSSAMSFDYRQIETAPWNPLVGNFLNVYTLFNVDSTAGVIDYSGNPGFDQVTWLFEKAQIAANGVADITKSGSASVINYPNPFSGQTNIHFTLENAEPVSLRIADLMGKEVFHASYGILGNGPQEINLDAAKLTAGSYPYVITTGDSHLSGVLKVVK